MDTIDVPAIRAQGERMKAILGLSVSPVGVRFLDGQEGQVAGAEILGGHRYCQAVMKARRGAHVVLDGEGISCPAAAAAFGFRPLPAGLRSGKGLVGYGIVSDETVGRRMFEAMPRLEPGQVKALYLFPLEQAKQAPDVVIVEAEVEQLMWINLAYLHATGGERVYSTTAILQATCVDSTIIPYLEGRLNFGYGCYGCRDATDLGGSETVVGFPAAVLPAVVDHLAFLAQKAIPNSRSKRAWGVLEGRPENEHQDKGKDVT